MSLLEDEDVEDFSASVEEPATAKRKLSRLRKVGVRNPQQTESSEPARKIRSPQSVLGARNIDVSLHSSPDDAIAAAAGSGQQEPAASGSHHSLIDDASADNNMGSQEEADATTGNDGASSEAAATEDAGADDGAELSDAEGAECNRAGGDYWDEEDELLDDLQREGGKSLEDDTPAPSAMDSEGHEGDDADDSDSGKPGSASQHAQLNAQKQRLLRESALRDRIGKGHAAEIAPLSGILAKLKAQRREVIERKKQQPVRAPSPPPEEEAAEADADDDDDILLISDDEDTLAAATDNTVQRPVEESQDLRLDLGLQSQQARAAASMSQPSLHLTLDSQMLDSQALPELADSNPPTPAADGTAERGPSGSAAAADSAATDGLATPARSATESCDARTVTASAPKSGSKQLGPANEDAQPQVVAQQCAQPTTDMRAALRAVAVPAAPAANSPAVNDTDAAAAAAPSAANGACDSEIGASEVEDSEDDVADNRGSGSDASSIDSDDEAEDADDTEEAQVVEGAHSHSPAEGAGSPADSDADEEALVAARAAIKNQRPVNFRNNAFFEMEAEMSEDEGHSDDGDDSDADADGMLAELIGNESVGKKDSARRAKLHVQWLQQQDEAAMQGVVAAMRSGWRRPRNNGLDDWEGTDRDARRRRAALMGVDEEDLEEGAFDVSTLFRGARPGGDGSASEDELADEAELLRAAQRQRILDASQELEPEAILEGSSQQVLELLRGSNSGAAAPRPDAASQRSRLPLFGSELTNTTSRAGTFLGRTAGGNGGGKVTRGGAEHSQHGGRSFVFGRGDDSNSGLPEASKDIGGAGAAAAAGPISFSNLRQMTAGPVARPQQKCSAAALLGMLSQKPTQKAGGASAGARTERALAMAAFKKKKKLVT